MLSFAAWSFVALLTGSCSQAAQTGFDGLSHRQLTPSEPPVSLLAIMRTLRHRSSSSSAAQRATLEEGSSLREKQLSADMGRLEDQLEAWQQTGMALQKQVLEQQSATQQLKDQERRVAQDEQAATDVMRACKIFVCATGALGFILSAYITMLHGKGAKMPAPGPASEGQMPMDADAAVPQERAAELPQATQDVAEEMDIEAPSHAKSEAAQSADEDLVQDIEAPSHTKSEDNAQAPLKIDTKPSVPAPLRIPTAQAAKESDIAAPLASPAGDIDSPKCQYFSLAEESSDQPKARTAEEQWWMD